MREKYESLSLAVLKDLAKARGMKGISAMKKGELIEKMLVQDMEEQNKAPDTVLQETEPDAVQFVSAVTETTEPDVVQAVRTVTEAAEPDAVQTARVAAETAVSAADMMQMRNNDAVQGYETGDGQADFSLGAVEAPARTERQYMSRTSGRGDRQQRMSGAAPMRPERQTGMNGAAPMRPERQTGMNGAAPMRPERQTGMNGAAPMRPERQTGMNGAAPMRPERQAGMNGAAPMRPERQTGMSGAAPMRTERQTGMNGTAPMRTERQTGMNGTEDMPSADLSQLDSGLTATGILEVIPDGFGFIRSDNYLPGENDVYVSPSQIRRFGLKTGDIISGNTRIKTQTEKFSALLYLKTINGKSPSEVAGRYNFEDMTPIFPNERMRMERGSRAVAMRIVDLFSPIGKGQRGMIVSPPKAGKTTLLKDVAHSILENDPNMKLLILLIDERPEEVTDIKEAIQGENVEVIYSTFDELPEHHKRVSEMVIERAKRLVEQNENVTILLDSITRLARAYNLTVPPSGRTLSGGLDPAALHMPKRFFGAARNMREGGSLTILATALVDTGSKMDDVVYEEFKGTGNMELVLDRKLSEKRVFPAIDIPKSGTRREDLLLDREEQEAVYIMRRALNGMKSDEAVENILNMFVHTKDNRELVQRVRRQKFI